jgi:hypothetical protein
MGSIIGPLNMIDCRQFLVEARAVADAHPECRQMLADCRRAELHVRASDAPDIAAAIRDNGFADWRGVILFSPDRLLFDYVTKTVAASGYSLRAFTDYLEALSWLREGTQKTEI